MSQFSFSAFSFCDAMRHFCENSLLICINGFAFAVAIALTKKTLIKSNVTMEIS